jgi:O-succinylbenzoate synthase
MQSVRYRAMTGLYLIANKVAPASRVMHDEDNLAHWGEFGPYPTFSMELHLRVQKALFFFMKSMQKEKCLRKRKK